VRNANVSRSSISVQRKGKKWEHKDGGARSSKTVTLCEMSFWSLKQMAEGGEVSRALIYKENTVGTKFKSIWKYRRHNERQENA
jgi:hypothetical protein